MGLLLKIDYESQQSLIEILLIVLNVVLICAIIVSVVLSVYISNHEVFDLVDIVKSSNKLNIDASSSSLRTRQSTEADTSDIGLSSISLGERLM